MNTTTILTKLIRLLTASFFYGVVLITTSCSNVTANKDEVPAKEEMPAELKDSTLLKMEQESAIDKLKGTIDTAAK